MDTQTSTSNRIRDRVRDTMRGTIARVEDIVMKRVEDRLAPLRSEIEDLKERVNLLEAEDRQDPAT